LRATELRALPDGRFEIVLELTPKAAPRQRQPTNSGKSLEAVAHAS
jgi:hypothetical protein